MSWSHDVWKRETTIDATTITIFQRDSLERRCDKKERDSFII